MTPQDILQLQVDSYNALEFENTDGVECPLCKNKGYIFTAVNGSLTAVPCKCAKLRKAHKLALKSNCTAQMERCTFDKYEIKETWQQNICNKAHKFTTERNGFFFIGGQVGSGKTFICNAMLNNFLENGIESRYYMWGDIATELNKAVGEDNGHFDAFMQILQTVPCLFIDDFFRNAPTQAEKDKAFKIINARYNGTLGGQPLLTIISSEKMLDEIIDIDEAIGSRIYELATDEYSVNIRRDNSRNYRTQKIKNAIQQKKF